MRILRTLRRITFGALVLSAAAIEISRIGTESAVKSAPKKLQIVINTVALTVFAVLLLLAAGGLLFVLSGIYPIAAEKPHFAPVRLILQTMRTRSVQFHSRGIELPNLQDGSLIKSGFFLYRKHCQPCHGAPGVPAEQIGLGINPKPPQLVTSRTRWSDAQIYWIISHGLKMSGMPAFAPQLNETDRWGIVAFLRRLSRLSPSEYQKLIASADSGLELSEWGNDDAQGFSQLNMGNLETGKQLLLQYGCVTCHAIPAIADAHVGPSLAAFAERQYIAGSIVNLPTNVMNWIMNPRAYKPHTAMPVLNVKAHESVDIAAYLYTLGSPTRINSIKETSAKIARVVP